ncbi:hypothetical protein WJX72_008742 [[Myrmecia] bisecta]|uniref:Uncharacterized protein n=1 Tax=[Myrmecia] bisecta TaxID=41462 RepID=A0AAW1PH82_9CHLO
MSRVDKASEELGISNCGDTRTLDQKVLEAFRAVEGTAAQEDFSLVLLVRPGGRKRGKPSTEEDAVAMDGGGALHYLPPGAIAHCRTDGRFKIGRPPSAAGSSSTARWKHELHYLKSEPVRWQAEHTADCAAVTRASVRGVKRLHKADGRTIGIGVSLRKNARPPPEGDLAIQATATAYAQYKIIRSCYFLQALQEFTEVFRGESGFMYLSQAVSAGRHLTAGVKEFTSTLRHAVRAAIQRGTAV